MHDKALLTEMYRRMVRIRRFEEALIEAMRRGESVGGHLSNGQEAASVGACLALRGTDRMTGTHRSHGHEIAKGARLGPLMAEIYGKATGVCKGKGGSMHLADFSVGSLGECAIVGGAMPIAVGAALSAQLRGSDEVVVCFFGDGASNAGAFHESLNLASVWHLAVVFVCENNGYAVTEPASTYLPIENVADRASAYGMPGTVVDGQDVRAVYDVGVSAVQRARRGDGPSLIEAKTYRFRDHAEFGPLGERLTYRTADEVASWMEHRDPITNFRAAMLEEGLVAEAELDAIDGEVAREVADALEFARTSPAPDPAEAFEDLYASRPSI